MIVKRVLLVAAAALGGCTLIDQNTFHPGANQVAAYPVAPKPVVPPPTPSGPKPLLTISPGARPADYASVLHKAVNDARARKADVTFDVVEMEPPNIDATATAPGTDIVLLGAGAADVARSIVAEGVAPARVRLAARPDASAIPKEVRVYVR